MQAVDSGQRLCSGGTLSGVEENVRSEARLYDPGAYRYKLSIKSRILHRAGFA